MGLVSDINSFADEHVGHIGWLNNIMIILEGEATSRFHRLTPKKLVWDLTNGQKRQEINPRCPT